MFESPRARAFLFRRSSVPALCEHRNYQGKIWNLRQAVGGHRPPLQSLKIRPNLVVFFVPDTVHFFQVVRAPKRPGVDDSARHYGADTRYQSQLFFRRGVDVELGREQSLVFARAPNRRCWCWRYRNRRRGTSKRLRGRAWHIQWPCACGPSSNFPPLRLILEFLEFVRCLRIA